MSTVASTEVSDKTVNFCFSMAPMIDGPQTEPEDTMTKQPGKKMKKKWNRN